jgi:hypothetical protein
MAEQETVQLGENVTITVKGDTATITIDLSHRGKPSSSGKSIIVASTGGNQAIPGTDVILGLNAYVKAK